jgi:hypothetical protein
MSLTSRSAYGSEIAALPVRIARKIAIAIGDEVAAGILAQWSPTDVLTWQRRAHREAAHDGTVDQSSSSQRSRQARPRRQASRGVAGTGGIRQIRGVQGELCTVRGAIRRIAGDAG